MSDVVPQLLQRLRDGDESAKAQLTTALYPELRRIAAIHLRRERPGHTLQTTALVHEAYLKLCEHPQMQYADRTHFLAAVSRVMRHVLVDYARARSTQKRSRPDPENWCPPQAITFEVNGEIGAEKIDMLDLERALEARTEKNERLARVIEMRYFGGMTAEETAEELGESIHVVRHDLRFAQAWLRQKLSGS